MDIKDIKQICPFCKKTIILPSIDWEVEYTKRERERCVRIIKKKFMGIIKYREENIQHKSRKLTGTFNWLCKNIVFLIENPYSFPKTKIKKKESENE